MTSPAPCAIDEFLTELQDKDNNKTWWNLGPLGAVMDAVKLTTPTLQFVAHSMKARKREKNKGGQKDSSLRFVPPSRCDYMDVIAVRGKFDTIKNHSFNLNVFTTMVATIFTDMDDRNRVVKFLADDNICFFVMRRYYTTSRNYTWQPAAFLLANNPMNYNFGYVSYCGVSNGTLETVDIGKDMKSEAYWFDETATTKPAKPIKGCKGVGLMSLLMRVTQKMFNQLAHSETSKYVFLIANIGASVEAATYWYDQGFNLLPRNHQKDAAIPFHCPHAPTWNRVKKGVIAVSEYLVDSDKALIASNEMQLLFCNFKNFGYQFRKTPSNNFLKKAIDNPQSLLPVADNLEEEPPQPSTNNNNDNNNNTNNNNEDYNSDDDSLSVDVSKFDDELLGFSAMMDFYNDDEIQTEEDAEAIGLAAIIQQYDVDDAPEPAIVAYLDEIERFQYRTYKKRQMPSDAVLAANKYSLGINAALASGEITREDLIPTDQVNNTNSKYHLLHHNEVVKPINGAVLYPGDGTAEDMVKIYRPENAPDRKSVKWHIENAMLYQQHTYKKDLSKQEAFAYASLDDHALGFSIDPEEFDEDESTVNTEQQLVDYRKLGNNRNRWMEEATALGMLDENNLEASFFWQWTILDVGNIMNQCKEEMYWVIHDALYGAEVMDIKHHHVEMSMDTKAIASWNVRYKYEKNFISPGVDHPVRLLPKELFQPTITLAGQTDYFLEPDGKPQYIGQFGEMKQWKTKNDAFIAHIAALGFREKPPSLPKMRYEIPQFCFMVNPDPSKKGYFQGLARVPTMKGFKKFQVGLTNKMMRSMFANNPEFIQHLKDRAMKTPGRRKHRFISVPPGNTKTNTVTPAQFVSKVNNKDSSKRQKICMFSANNDAPFYLRLGRLMKFQQGANNTCLVDSTCGALHDFGLTSIVDDIQTNHRSQLTSSNPNVLGCFNNLIIKKLGPIGLALKSVSIKTVEQIIKYQYNFPVILLLESVDGASGQHAIAIYNQGIYDSNASHVLALTPASLNWACGDTGNSICIGAKKAYQVVPKACVDKPVLAYTTHHGNIWPCFQKEKATVKVGCTKFGITKMRLVDFFNNTIE